MTGGTSDVVRQLPIDPEIAALIASLQDSLSNRDAYRTLLRCRGQVAQRLLDCFQWVLDMRELNTTFRSNLIMATQRLSATSGLYPACYELTDVIQTTPYPVVSGGFADIYKGTFHGHDVCLKAIRIFESSQVEHILKKFAKEAILWIQLSHPNILPIYGLYPFLNQIRLVSPWMEDGDIVRYLKRNPEAARLPLTIDIAQGLSYLHKNQIIHGDLKGLNILIDDSGRARLADFGISGVSDPDIISLTSYSSATLQGGTVRWQAPELFGAEDDDMVKNTVESDVYALSCVFYEIFTGDVPYANITNLATVMFKITSGTLPTQPPSSSSSWLHWGLTNHIWQVMQHCWNKDPVQRPSVNEVIERLDSELKPDKRPNASKDVLFPEAFRDKVGDLAHIMTVSELDNLMHREGDKQSGTEGGSPITHVTLNSDNSPTTDSSSILAMSQAMEKVKLLDIPLSETTNHFKTILNVYIKAMGFRRFFAPNDPYLQKLAQKASALTRQASTNLGNRENIQRLLRLSLYQLVFYCDDSGSMAMNNRFADQRRLVTRMAHIATKIVPDEEATVELHFINSSLASSKLGVEAIEGAMNRVRPGGGTKIGTTFRYTVLERLVYNLLPIGSSTNRFKRPLLVHIITDGSPSTEAKNTLENAILGCKKKLVEAGYERTAVIFCLGQVGNDYNAVEYLEGLRRNPQLRDVLYCVAEQLDAKLLKLQADDRGLDSWLLRLLTEPIMESEQ